jgi:hypothetical protein
MIIKRWTVGYEFFEKKETVYVIAQFYPRMAVLIMMMAKYMQFWEVENLLFLWGLT